MPCAMPRTSKKLRRWKLSYRCSPRNWQRFADCAISKTERAGSTSKQSSDVRSEFTRPAAANGKRPTAPGKFLVAGVLLACSGPRHRDSAFGTGNQPADLLDSARHLQVRAAACEWSGRVWARPQATLQCRDAAAA